MRALAATACTVVLLATGALAGCAPHEEAQVDEEAAVPDEPGGSAGAMDEGAGYEEGEGEGAQELFLEGELTDEGVECQAFRSTEGDLYTLTGDLAGFQNGNRVRIVAAPVEASTCMQGTTVHVVEISAVEQAPPRT